MGFETRSGRRIRKSKSDSPEPELPKDDLRRQIGCRLTNLGNSCYQSVILQLLVNLPEVRERLSAFVGEHSGAICPADTLCFPRDVAKHAVDAFQAAACASALSARWILPYQEQAAYSVGSMFRQSDPADFLHAVVDWCFDQAPEGHRLEGLKELIEGASYEREWSDQSPFADCSAAPRNLHVHPFLTLHIPIPAPLKKKDAPSVTLEQCLELSVFEEKVVGNRECDNCPHGRHEKHQQLRLSQLPRYLTLRLLRFDNSLKKTRTKVEYTHRLDISAHADGGDGHPAEYELVGVVVHQGRTRQRGHYYVYVRVAERKHWWLFDDDHKHTMVTSKKVLSHTEDGYMLVYRRIMPGEAPVDVIDDVPLLNLSRKRGRSVDVTSPVPDDDDGVSGGAVSSIVVLEGSDDGNGDNEGEEHGEVAEGKPPGIPLPSDNTIYSVREMNRVVDAFADPESKRVKLGDS